MISYGQGRPLQNGIMTHSSVQLTKAQKKKIKDSLKVYTFKLEHEGYNPIVLEKRAEIYFLLKKNNKAVTDLTVLINNNANNLGEIYYKRALNKLLSNNNLERSACEDFKKAQELQYIPDYKHYLFCE